MPPAETLPVHTFADATSALPGGVGSRADIVRRMQSTPVNVVHKRILIILGCATFFDGFDAITIAYILPSLMAEWQLTQAQGGLLVAAGYMGQAIGAVLFGMLAGRRGRVGAICASVALVGVGGLLCSIASRNLGDLSGPMGYRADITRNLLASIRCDRETMRSRLPKRSAVLNNSYSLFIWLAIRSGTAA